MHDRCCDNEIQARVNFDKSSHNRTGAMGQLKKLEIGGVE